MPYPQHLTIFVKPSCVRAFVKPDPELWAWKAKPPRSVTADIYVFIRRTQMHDRCNTTTLLMGVSKPQWKPLCMSAPFLWLNNKTYAFEFIQQDLVSRGGLSAACLAFHGKVPSCSDVVCVLSLTCVLIVYFSVSFFFQTMQPR